MPTDRRAATDRVASLVGHGWPARSVARERARPVGSVVLKYVIRQPSRRDGAYLVAMPPYL